MFVGEKIDMEYTLQMGLWNSVFAVPTALVDRYLKLAGKEQLQVLLWMLRHGGESVSPELLAEELGLDQDSVLDGLEYWVQEGLLTGKSGEFSPAPVQEAPRPTPAPAAAPQKELDKLPPKKRLLKPDTQHLTARMGESPEICFLMQEAETTFGKTISPAMASTLLTICDDYGLPVEVVVMLIHYAKEVGKTGTSYIDSVARDWAQSGIFTLEAAESKLQDLDQRRQAWAKVQSAAGLPRRSPSKKEEDAAFRWVWEWKFTVEMLSAAYERCVDNTGKFNVNYIDKILDGWHKNGVRNLQELEALDAKKKEDRENTKTYDIEELEKMSFFDLPEEL